MWKEIEGSRGQYQVSDAGEIRNAYTGRILKPYLNKSTNRYTVTLGGYIHKTVQVDGIVAKTFLGEGRIHHKNGNTTDCRLKNLEVY